MQKHNRMKRNLFITLGAAGVILFSMQVTQAQIYREVFGNLSTGTNSAPSSVGWAGNWGATASDASVGDNAPGTFNNFGVSTALGKPQNLDNINAGGPALSTANGLMFVSQAGQNFIAYTTGYTVDQTLTPINDISFYAGSTSSPPLVASLGFALPSSRTAIGMPPPKYSPTVLNVTMCRQFHSHRHRRRTTGYLQLDNRRECLGHIELHRWHVSGARRRFGRP